MSSRSKSRRSNKVESIDRQRPLTNRDLDEIRRIVNRMLLDIRRAVRICCAEGKSVLNEELDQFWALVKYVENVQDGIVRLDNKHKTVFPRLIEFPKASDDQNETTWKSLKGMRSRLAHAFDNIDHKILWETVEQDFPKLQALLEVVQFTRCVNGEFTWDLHADPWMDLPTIASPQQIDGNNSIPVIVFDERGKANCVRIGRISNDEMAIASTRLGLSIQEIDP